MYIPVYFEADVIERHSSECVSFPDSDGTADCVMQEVVSYCIVLFPHRIVLYTCLM
jgi:hypothetical protein